MILLLVVADKKIKKDIPNRYRYVEGLIFIMNELGEPKSGEYDIIKLLGYGEDALTLWALKNRLLVILNKLNDSSNPSDCLILFRPSFGRGRGTFGEFDSILASSKKIYLIESKWDNFSEFKNDEIDIKPVQETRHRIFSWYIQKWDKKYVNNWETFIKEQSDDFRKKFPKKKMAPVGSLLAINIEFILTELQRHYGTLPSGHNIKDVLIFFYNKNKSTPPTKIGKGFKLIDIDYSQELIGNFIKL